MLASRLHQVCAVAVIVIALVHTAVTATYGKWDADAVWFAATGLGFLLLGALNLAARADTAATRVRALCRFANVVAALFAAAALLAVPVPHAFVFFAAIAGQAAFGLRVLARPA
jgi:hypothetical protein